MEEEKEEAVMALARMMMASTDRQSLEYLIQSGKENEFEIGHQSINRAKEKFSTETGFEGGKTTEISKVHRLIIVTNASERWGMPFWSSIISKGKVSSRNFEKGRKIVDDRVEVR